MSVRLMNPDFTQFEGLTFKPKLIAEIYAYVKEDRIKNKLTHHNYLPGAIVASLKDGEVKKIGCSIPNDIVNDNFGELAAGQFHPVLTTIKDVTTFVSTDGITRSLRLYSGGGDLWNEASAGSDVQIGEGTSTPTRIQFDIDTAFTNGGVEDSPQPSDAGTFIIANSQVQVGKFIGPTAGSGLVKEVCLFGIYFVIGIGLKRFLLSRDLVGSIPFAIGESVSVSYVWSF